MDAAKLSEVWRQAISWQPLPPRVLVLLTAALAFVTVASGRIWPVSRTVVTIAHEGGHALMALITGRRLAGVRVHASTAGETLSAGYLAGPGIVLTTAAGYTAPPVLGLGGAALLASRHLTGMLLLSLLLLAGLAVAVRNVYGMLAVLTVAAGTGVVLWWASPLIQAAFGYSMTWFLLLGGVRPVLELRRTRRGGRSPGSDADQLARLTGLPGGAWVFMFGCVALGALGLGALWLVR